MQKVGLAMAVGMEMAVVAAVKAGSAEPPVAVLEVAAVTAAGGAV